MSNQLELLRDVFNTPDALENYRRWRKFATWQLVESMGDAYAGMTDTIAVLLWLHAEAAYNHVEAESRHLKTWS